MKYAQYTDYLQSSIITSQVQVQIEIMAEIPFYIPREAKIIKSDSVPC